MFHRIFKNKSLKNYWLYLALVTVFIIAGGLITAHAHASEQGFVLLLPTNFYILAGCLAVVASILIVAFIPLHWLVGLFRPFTISNFAQLSRTQNFTSLISTILIFWLIYVGFSGPHNPLTNLLPLTIWTVWWMAIVALHGVVGGLWLWLNPWSGLYNFVFDNASRQTPFKLPKALSQWPATLIFLTFFGFLIADPAPDDPSRLAIIVASYWLFTFCGMALFGAKDWLNQCESFHVFFRLIGFLAPIQLDKKIKIGWPGWAALNNGSTSIAISVFVLMTLASGSFDGLSETFWWMGKLGINPLEYPGRSALITPTIAGLIAANLIFCLLFALCIWLGVQLANHRCKASDKVNFSKTFGQLAISILPIAFGYHVAHYFISFLVSGQYVVVALSDPLAVGANYFGLSHYHVSTGFLKTFETVKTIWLAQAGIIVSLHILSVIMAHHIATSLFKTRLRILISQVPLAIFMIFYTFFGLWLLATPRSV